MTETTMHFLVEKGTRAECICVSLFGWQIYNSNATHLCLDQGVKENHVATLHPCHGWNPQVESQDKHL